MAKLKKDNEKIKLIKKTVVSELKKNPNFLGNKELKVCQEKSHVYNIETVNIFIKQTDNNSYMIMLYNLSSEYNALCCIQNALMNAFVIKKIDLHESNSKGNHYAATVVLKL